MCAVIFLLSAFLSLVDLSKADGVHWGYPDLNTNQEFPNWGGLCDTGKLQSPINLSLRRAVKGIYEVPLQGINYGETINALTLVNNGHSGKMSRLQISNFGIDLRLKGGPLASDYILEQIHFHWWSEHTIDSVRYPFEAHLVHRNAKYENITAAAQKKDGIAVVAILFHASLQRNEAIDEILEYLPKVNKYEHIKKPIRVNVVFEVDDLLPELDNYLTYNGSLTTPSCSEVVTWLVMAETYPITIDQIEAFKAVEFESGRTLNNNFRFVQNLNDRALIIVANKKTDDFTNNSSSRLQYTAVNAILFVLIVKLFL
uniref:Carbonic anhydrase n=1 Tax=Glossina morsitans morsitans TaxID=37546 RepID=A0A1B0G219_GLOMM